MQAFSALSIILSMALAISASPIEKRDKGTTYITCDDTPVATGFPTVNVRVGKSTYEDYYYGLGSATTTGSDGNVDQVLVHLGDNGAGEWA